MRKLLPRMGQGRGAQSPLEWGQVSVLICDLDVSASVHCRVYSCVARLPNSQDVCAGAVARMSCSSRADSAANGSKASPTSSTRFTRDVSVSMQQRERQQAAT